jgi:FG-GAP-like repeat
MSTMNRLLAGCSLGLFVVAGCNRLPGNHAPTSCTIQGSNYSSAQANPTNPCQVCIPSEASGDWTDQPPGTKCGTTGTQFCSGGACLTACLIGSSLIAPNALSPDNPCQSCQPIQSSSAWTDLALGSPCADGGGICTLGGCESGCQIGGVFFANDTPSPTNKCQGCQPALSTTSFSPLTGVPLGGDCGSGAYCYKGTCVSGCAIGGATEVPGEIDPANACQSCQPSVNPTGWSDVPSGTKCGPSGAVCLGGACLSGCLIGGILYAPGGPSPLDPCQTCQPAMSATAFSPFNGLPPGGCNGGTLCNQGICEEACLISGSIVVGRSFKPNDTSFCCSPKTDPSKWTQTLLRGATYTAGSNAEFPVGTQAIAAGDFNGDGFQDVAVLNADNTVSVFLNQGDGSFAPPATYPTGMNPQALAAGDFNNDGFDDLIVGLPSTLQVLVSSGFNGGFDGGMTPGATLVLNQGALVVQTIAVGDLNGDRALDVVGVGASKSISVFLNLNDGTGGFGPQKQYGTATDYASQIALGDFQGDSVLDIAFLFGDLYGSSVTVLGNDGAGTFDTGVTYPIDPSTVAIATGSFTGNQISDIAAATWAQTDVLIGIGDGGFLPAVGHALNAAEAVATGDLNGDGLSDVVVLTATPHLGAINLLISQGNGTFAPVSSIEASVETSLVIRDFDGDGAPDLAIVDSNFNSVVTSWTLWLNGCP